MPGSSLSLSGPNVILNTAVAEELKQFADILESAPAENLNEAIHDLLKKVFTEHERIIFNGNGYTDEWLVEAEKRGLPNYKSTPDALPHFLDEKNITLLTGHHVFTREEMFSRYEILLEEYCKTLHIEAKTMSEMVQKEVLPSIFAYTGELTSTGLSKKDLMPSVSTRAEEKLISRLSTLADSISDELDVLNEKIRTAERIEDNLETGHYYHDESLTEMETIRQLVNEAEELIPEEILPYPTYDAMLFYV